MKIAIHADGPTIRGNERQVLHIAIGLKGRGHRMVVSCRAGTEVEEAFRRAEIPTTGVRPGGDADLYNALRFVRWLRRERPDALLLTSWNRAFISAWCGRVAGVPRVVHRLGAVQEIRPLRGALERYALEHWYHDVIVNSAAVREQLLKAAPGLDPTRVHRVQNAVAIRDVRPADLRAELGLPADSTVAVVPGGWEPRKGFQEMIAAAAELPSDLHLVLVGGGSPERGDALRGGIAGLGMGGRVHLLGHREDVPALLAAADLVVLPSRNEGLSVAMLEAMAAGKPIVRTDIGGVQDALAAQDGRGPAGWIVPPRDPAALAAGIRSLLALLGTPAVRERQEEARWRAEHWFTEDRMLDGYEAVLTGGPT